MASAEDTKNRLADSSQVEMNYNQRVAEAQRDKTSFRAEKMLLDRYDPARLIERSRFERSMPATSDIPPNKV